MFFDRTVLRGGRVGQFAAFLFLSLLFLLPQLSLPLLKAVVLASCHGASV
jgi:hypothetical protein